MKRILCLGDSNTWGYDPRSYLGSRYPADVRWTGLLQGMGWEVVNCGQNGLCIPTEAQLPAVADLLRLAGRLDAVSVMLGSNDLLNGESAAGAAARMEALLRCVSENVGDARVLLLAPPPMRPGEWVRDLATIDESVRLAEEYRRLAARVGASFADAGAWGVGIAFDGVHFLPEGHAAFAEGVAAALEAV